MAAVALALAFLPGADHAFELPKAVLCAYWRWLYALLLPGQCACLLLSQARGAWLGSGAAVLTFALLWAAPRQRPWLLVAVLTRTGLVLAFFLILTMPEGLLSGLRQLPGSDRVAALTDTKSGPTAAMLTIWRTTLDLVLS